MAAKSIKPTAPRGKRTTTPRRRIAVASDGGKAAATGKDRKPEKSGEKDKPKRRKVVRDSFTMPAGDYALIGALKKRCLGLGVAVKKSELLRAGLAMVAALPDGRLAEAMTSVATVRTGRPPGKAAKDA